MPGRQGSVSRETWKGLSVPYIANLENGRGNPTTAALTRLAEALGMRLVVTLVTGEESEQAGASESPAMPASLVRLGRTARFRQAVKVIAATLGLEADEFSVQLVAALAMIAHSMGRDLAEADWWRLLDALLLIATHPAGPWSRLPGMRKSGGVSATRNRWNSPAGEGGRCNTFSGLWRPARRVMAGGSGATMLVLASWMGRPQGE
jgi:transcriptional regulator with XRE-family HTH domain